MMPLKQMTDVKRVRRRTQLLDDLRNGRRYWELKRKLKIEKDENNSLSIEHKKQKYVIFFKPMKLLLILLKI